MKESYRLIFKNTRNYLKFVSNYNHLHCNLWLAMIDINYSL